MACDGIRGETSLLGDEIQRKGWSGCHMQLVQANLQVLKRHGLELSTVRCSLTCLIPVCCVKNDAVAAVNGICN